MIGRTLSHYHIVESLGSGGMGAVFRANDTLLGRPVALKFPHRHLVEDPAVRERFLREARAASVLDHPNIVVLYDVCEVEGEVFLAMQCVEGGSLQVRLRSGALPLAEALAVGRAVADALAHAHGRGVVHRDVKPENILLDARGLVKVVDFGVALLPGESRVTQTGAVVGTVGYLAPEVLQGRTADARADLYALGAVLYEMCAGVAPFGGEHPEAILYQAVHAEPAPLPAALPVGLRTLIGALLAKDPARRPANAVEVADRLLDLMQGRTAAAPAAPLARSIAVLGFENLTGNPEDDYFCAGITEDLLTDLLKIPDLQVASRSLVAPLRAKPLDARQAGRDLGVATLLQGSVRRAGGRVRVTSQLVRAESGYQMWAERYDRSLEDVFEVQEDISRQISAALRLVLEPEGPAHAGRRTRSPRAYDLRLQALALFRRFEEGDMRRAIALLEEAVREDPRYALGLAELAECRVQMVCKNWDLDPRWLEEAERDARRALELAPLLPEGHRAVGHVWNHRRQMTRALRDFHRAVELDPRYCAGLTGLATNYLYLGDVSRAEVYARRAVEVDPQDPRGPLTLAHVLLRQGRIAEARETAARELSREPGRTHRQSLLEVLVRCHGWQGRRAELEALLDEAALQLSDARGRVIRGLALCYLGRLDEAREALRPLAEEPTQDGMALVSQACVHVLLGEREAALAALERAAAIDVVDLHELRTDPQLSTLQGEPRFERLFTLQS